MSYALGCAAVLAVVFAFLKLGGRDVLSKLFGRGAAPAPAAPADPAAALAKASDDDLYNEIARRLKAAKDADAQAAVNKKIADTLKPLVS